MSGDCIPVDKPVWDGPDPGLSLYYAKKGFIVADIWINVDEETGYLDYSKKELVIPRLGMKLKMKKMIRTLRVSSTSMGGSI